MKTDILSMSSPELKEALRAIGEPAFRGGQIFKWLHNKRVRTFHEMSDLSLSLREKCDEIFYISSINIKKRLVSEQDGTVKYLYELPDGNCVEAVRMEYKHGISLCVSTQVGCRMGCGFCASTTGGLVRNLTPGEMLSEIYEAEKDLGGKISGVVLMGIGEPLDNFDNVLRFLELLSSPDGMNMSLRHVSLSTCGLVDQIDNLARHKLGLTLSVSLHAPNDALRNKIMPVNKKWPVNELLDACKRYFQITGRRVSFEYALIDGENDGEAHARELAEKLRGMNCHVNLIPINAVEGKKYKASRKKSVERFASILTSANITTTIRRTLGSDISAACGQLRQLEAGHNPRPS